MSQLRTIRDQQSTILSESSATRTDIAWIKREMDRGAERMDRHDSQIGKLQTGQTRHTAVVGTLSSMAGILVAVVLGKFGIRLH